MVWQAVAYDYFSAFICLRVDVIIAALNLINGGHKIWDDLRPPLKLLKLMPL